MNSYSTRVATGADDGFLWEMLYLAIYVPPSRPRQGLWPFGPRGQPEGTNDPPRLITEHWDRIGQFFAAFASGQTTASVALKRLVGHGPKNRFYRATRELGPRLQDRVHPRLPEPAGASHADPTRAPQGRTATRPRPVRPLRPDWADWISATSNAKPARRAACFSSSQLSSIGRFGEIDRVLSEAGSDADDLNFELLSHISPIGWDNVLLYGEYQLNRSLVRSERLSV